MVEARGLAMLLLSLMLAFTLFCSTEAAVSKDAQTNRVGKLRHSTDDGEEVNKEVVNGDDTDDAKDDGDNDDDDDDADDDDGQKTDPKPHAAEEAALEKAIDDIEAKLTANLAERTQVKASATQFSDEKRSTKQIEDSQKQVAKEMESTAMASMLAQMWKELRMFEVPDYTTHTAAELEALKKEGQDLQAELGAAKAKLDAGRKRWAGIQVAVKSKIHDLPTAPTTAPALGVPTQQHYNFWQWPRGEQRTTWVGTTVYLCFGIVAAFLYNRARLHAKALLPQKDYRHFGAPDGFSFGLFDCLSDANICVIGCCCPCLRWADTLDRQGIVPFWTAFAAMFALMLLHVYSYGLSFLAVAVLGVVCRQRLYRHFHIENNSVLKDCLAWLLCQPCAIIQEAREASVQRSVV